MTAMAVAAAVERFMAAEGEYVWGPVCMLGI